MISSEALGPDGREVRCGKCGHMWFQAGERDSLDELPAEEAETPVAEDYDIGFIPHVEEAGPEPDIFKPKPDFKPSKQAAEPRAPSSPVQKQIAGVAVAAAIVSVLFLGLFIAKNPIGHSINFMGTAYETLGIHLSPLEPKIAIDRLKLTKAGDKLQGSMYLINLTSEAVPVDRITAELTDFDYKTIKSVDVKSADKTLKGESSSKVDFSFDAVPKDAVSVRVKISQ